MNDLRFHQWIKMFATAGRELDLAVVSVTKLTEPVAAFLNNIHQVFQMSAFPHRFFLAGKHIQMLDSAAMSELFGTAFPILSAEDERVAQKKAKDLRNEYLSETRRPPHLLPTFSDDSDYSSTLMTKAAPDIELLMSMQLVAAWTALETLFGDLWEAAVNAHPIELSDLSSPNQRQSEEGRQVPISRLQEFGFDLRDSMGTFLRKANKVQFTTLENIKEAYRRSFTSGSDPILKELDHHSLRALSAARNLIVHKAGILDDEYLKHANALPDLLPLHKKGEKLRLNGEVLASLLPPASACGTRFLMAVDAWLANSPHLK